MMTRILQKTKKNSGTNEFSAIDLTAEELFAFQMSKFVTAKLTR